MVFVNLLEVAKGIAQTAAAGKAVGAVAYVAEEAVAFAPHFSRKVGVFFIRIVVASIGEQRHRFNRKSKEVAAAFFVEPAHEVLLQPGKGFPFGSSAVGETEVGKNSFEIGFVEVAYIPEDCLVAAVSCRHIHGVHHLLEAVVYHFCEGARLAVVFHHLIKAGEIVIAIVPAYEVVHIHQELRSGHGAHELAGYAVHQIDEFTAEAL